MKTYRAYILCQLILTCHFLQSIAMDFSLTYDTAIYRTNSGILANCYESESFASCFLGKYTGNIIVYEKVNESCIVNPEEIEPKSEECLKIADSLQGKNQNINGTIRLEYPSNQQNFFWKEMKLQMLVLKHFDYFENLPVRPYRNLTDLKVLYYVIINAYKPVTLSTNIYQILSNLESLAFIFYHYSMELINVINLTQDYFRYLHKLKRLDLSGINMTSLPADIFLSLSKLKSLSLTNDNLASLPRDLLAAQYNLVVLNLEGNHLDSLPTGLFKHTPNLWKLILSKNRFSSLSSIIENIKPLHFFYKLDLSENIFKTVMDTGSYRNETIFSSFAFRNVSLLQLVDEYPIDYLYNMEMEFGKNERTVTTINLSNNRISHFDMNSISDADLKCPFKIDLRSNEINHIHALSTRIFNVTPRCKQEILIDGNPLRCDCKLDWINRHSLHSIVKTSNCDAVLCDWQPIMCPAKCVCSTQSEILEIDCSGAELSAIAQLPRRFSSMENATISVIQNRFSQLPSNTTLGYANVAHLNVSYNHITEILPTQLPPNLAVLDVRHNRLEGLSDAFLLTYLYESTTLQALYLAQNPWECDCSAKPLLLALRIHYARIPDVEQLLCVSQGKEKLLDVNVDTICANEENENFYIILASVIGGLVIVLLIVIVLYYKYQLQVQVWLYAHKICLCFINEHELDKDRTFDAFISYAHQDAHFVNHTLLPQLERGDPPYRICIHERNWLPGAYIPEQIVESVAQSRRTIIVLSQQFIDSDWARMEFRTAHQASLNEGRSRIIIIKYGEITNTELLDRELQAYLDMNTYLVWDDSEWCWSKLRYAMPHKKGEVSETGMLELRERVYVIGQVEVNRCRDERD